MFIYMLVKSLKIVYNISIVKTGKGSGYGIVKKY